MYEVRIKTQEHEQSLGYGNWNDTIKLFNKIKEDDTISYTDIGIFDETGELVWN